MLITCYLLMFSSLPFFVEGQIVQFLDQTPEIIRDSATVTQDWKHLEEVVKDVVNKLIKRLLPLIMEETQGLNISSSCMKDMIQVIGGVKKLKTWAIRFLDATAKGVDGLLTGTPIAFGAYDECVDTVVLDRRPGKHRGEVMFTGNYCMLRVKAHLPPKKGIVKMGRVLDELKELHKEGTIFSEFVENAGILYSFSLRLGLCVPSGCSVDDLNQLFAKVADYLRVYMKVKRCEVKEEPTYTPLMIFVISFYSFTGFLVLLGTLTDIYLYYTKREHNSLSIRVLLAFSFISNFNKLVDTSTSSENLSCLNGIRFITMTWVIQEHFYLLAAMNVAGGLFSVRDMIQEEWAVQVLCNPAVAVDTFFCLGGFLVCYVSTKYVVISRQKFSVIVYIIYRLWRILPALIFVILYTFIAELATSGPIAHDMFKPIVGGCESYWWSTILFINNIYRPSDGCLPHTWYLAVDMQLYIASLIILLPLFRWPKVGITIAIVCLAASMVGNAVEVYVKNFPPTFVLTNVDSDYMLNFMEEHYFRPHTHAGVYIIGILAGYFLAMNPNLKIPKIVQLLGWSCAIIFSTSILYGPFEWNQGREPTLWETIFFSSCHKVAWSLCIAWMIICCGTGHGGIVNHILSWKLWIPLGRLTYVAYLIHLTLLITVVASVRNTFPAQKMLGVWMFFGNLMVTYAVAFVGSMLIESPMIAFQKLLLPQRVVDTQKETGNHALDKTEVTKERDMQHLKGNLNAKEPYKASENEGFVYKL